MQDLFEDVLVPVASAALVKKTFQKPEQLLKYRLIHDERPEGWNEWFEAAGVPQSDSSAGLDFSDREMALRAAEAGYGVALCTQQFLDGPSILAQINSTELTTGNVWRAQSTATELSDETTRSVWQWLSEAAKST